MTTIYHVFTNNNDDWTKNYKQAVAIYKGFIKNYGCARLYLEEWNHKDDDEPISESCLLSYGGYPY